MHDNLCVFCVQAWSPLYNVIQYPFQFFFIPNGPIIPGFLQYFSYKLFVGHCLCTFFPKLYHHTFQITSWSKPFFVTLMFFMSTLSLLESNCSDQFLKPYFLTWLVLMIISICTLVASLL